MNRFFIPSQNIAENKVVFPKDIAHQILHVLRLKQDDPVEVLDNSGRVYSVSLQVHPGESRITGIVLESSEDQTEPKIPITLYFGLTNREKVEWILQKGTEVGVSIFRPFISERTLIQSPELSAKKIERWERIIREAAEQARRSRLPELMTPINLQDYLVDANEEQGLKLFAWEEADFSVQDLKEALQFYQGGNIGLFVGPEGGFTKEEAELADFCGCRIVSLGHRILRMETAAILFPALVLSGLNAL